MEFLQSPKFTKNNIVYSLIETPRDVRAAAAFCREKANGVLYQPKEEYNEVVEFAKKFNVMSFYMGVTDEINESEFRYMDGHLVPKAYFNWHDGEPNNFIPKLNKFCEPEGQDFVASQSGKWIDTKAESLFPFICQSSKPSDISITKDACSACHAFVSIINIKFTPDFILPYFDERCGHHASKYGSDSLDTCSRNQ